jgi:hypothetical protein
MNTEKQIIEKLKKLIEERKSMCTCSICSIWSDRIQKIILEFQLQEGEPDKDELRVADAILALEPAGELYRKVYIHNESDLPKDGSQYVFKVIGNDKMYAYSGDILRAYGMKVEWYLQSGEQKGVTNFNQQRIIKDIDDSKVEQKERMSAKEIIESIHENEEKPFVTERFGENWQDHIMKQFESEEIDIDSIIHIAWKQGRRAILLEKALKDQQPQEQKQPSDDLKDELIKFLKWYKSLSPASKCTVHPPAGSGGSYGIYDLTDAALINNYLQSHERRTLP